MENSKRKLSKGLKRLFIATAFIALFYVLFLVLFAYLATSAGDPEIAGFGEIVKYYFKGIVDLFIFNYANSSNIAYFALSVFLYALIVCWLIFLIAGAVVAHKKKRKVLWWAILLTFVNVLLYILYAAGSKKYWQIVNNSEPFNNNLVLMVVVLLIISLASLHFVTSIASYFWALFDSFLHPNTGEPVEEENKEQNLDDELIRNIIREELEKNQPFKVYVVNDNFAVAKEEPAPKEEEKEAEPEPVSEPVLEQVEEEPAPEELDIPLAVEPEEEEEAPEAPLEVANEEEEWNRSKRQPFLVRVVTADADIKANYNEIKNEILSYGVKARLSRGGETFRLHEKRYVKIYLVGKTLKVYFALSPEDYKDSTIPVEDVGHRPNYADMPLLFKVRSGLSVRRCKELVKAVCEKDGLTQGEVKDTNWVSELRKINAEKAKGKKGE